MELYSYATSKPLRVRSCCIDPVRSKRKIGPILGMTLPEIRLIVSLSSVSVAHAPCVMGQIVTLSRMTIFRLELTGMRPGRDCELELRCPVPPRNAITSPNRYAVSGEIAAARRSRGCFIAQIFRCIESPHAEPRPRH